MDINLRAYDDATITIKSRGREVTEKVYSKEANARMLTEAKKRQAAKMKGYEGDPCPDCGAWTMVRNGSCMKCDSCGSTTGCS